MKSSATTVEQYLAALPADRRAAIAAVRDVILKNLDADYEEGIQYGMIGYYVPHRVFPAGYHCDPKQPLPFAAIASQKNYMSLYLMSLYSGGAQGQEGPQSEYARWFHAAWRETGKKLDMGKSCIRFKALDDLPLKVIGEAIKRIPAKKWIECCQAAIKATKNRASGTKPAPARPAGTNAAVKKTAKKQPRK